jgi:hypothetical protein
MKVISLHQPWATFVVMNWKTIETRTHQRFKNLIGERIAIHAAQHIDRNEIRKNSYLQVHLFGGWEELDLIGRIEAERGKIICTALVIKADWCLNAINHNEWKRAAMCDIQDKFLIHFADIEPLLNPISFCGRQGIFHISEELIK